MKVDIHTMEGLLRGKCLPAKMLVNESLSAYLVRQFDALHERAEAAERERDEAIAQRDKSGESFYKAVQYGAKLEAEISRRDAAAGEANPVGFINGAREPVLYVAHIGIAIGTKLYTTAPPAVLPPEMIADETSMMSEHAAYWYNKGRVDTAVLCAQPQKPVVLPEDRADDKSVSTFDSEKFYDAGWNSRGKADKEALDAANIQYEVKS